MYRADFENKSGGESTIIDSLFSVELGSEDPVQESLSTFNPNELASPVYNSYDFSPREKIRNDHNQSSSKCISNQDCESAGVVNLKQDANTPDHLNPWKIHFDLIETRNLDRKSRTSPFTCPEHTHVVGCDLQVQCSVSLFSATSWSAWEICQISLISHQMNEDGLCRSNLSEGLGNCQSPICVNPQCRRERAYDLNLLWNESLSLNVAFPCFGVQYQNEDSSCSRQFQDFVPLSGQQVVMLLTVHLTCSKETVQVGRLMIPVHAGVKIDRWFGLTSDSMQCYKEGDCSPAIHLRIEYTGPASGESVGSLTGDDDVLPAADNLEWWYNAQMPNPLIYGPFGTWRHLQDIGNALAVEQKLADKSSDLSIEETRFKEKGEPPSSFRLTSSPKVLVTVTEIKELDQQGSNRPVGDSLVLAMSLLHADSCFQLSTQKLIDHVLEHEQDTNHSPRFLPSLSLIPQFSIQLDSESSLINKTVSFSSIQPAYTALQSKNGACDILQCSNFDPVLEGGSVYLFLTLHSVSCSDSATNSQNAGGKRYGRLLVLPHETAEQWVLFTVESSRTVPGPMDGPIVPGSTAGLTAASGGAAHSRTAIKIRVHYFFDETPPMSEGVAAGSSKKVEPAWPGCSTGDYDSGLLAYNALSQLDDGDAEGKCHLAKNGENPEIMENAALDKTKLLKLVLSRMASLVLELQRSQLELKVTEEELRFEQGLRREEMEARNMLEEYVAGVKTQLQAEHAATDRLKAVLAKSEDEDCCSDNHGMEEETRSPAVELSAEILIKHMLSFLSQAYKDMAVQYRDPAIHGCPDGSSENILQAAKHVSDLSDLCTRYFSALYVCFQAMLGVVCSVDLAANSCLMDYETPEKRTGLASEADSMSGLDVLLQQCKVELQSSLSKLECLDSADVLAGQSKLSSFSCMCPFSVSEDDFLLHLPFQERVHEKNTSDSLCYGSSEQSNHHQATFQKSVRSSLLSVMHVLDSISKKLSVLNTLSMQKHRASMNILGRLSSFKSSMTGHLESIDVFEHFSQEAAIILQDVSLGVSTSVSLENSEGLSRVLNEIHSYIEILDANTKGCLEWKSSSPSSRQSSCSKQQVMNSVPDEENHIIEESSSCVDSVDITDSEYNYCNTANFVDRTEQQESAVTNQGLKSKSESCIENKTCLNHDQLHSESMNVYHLSSTFAQVILPRVDDHNSVSSDDTVMVHTSNNVQETVGHDTLKELPDKIKTKTDLRPEAVKSACTVRSGPRKNSNRYTLHPGRIDDCRKPAGASQMEEYKNQRTVLSKSQEIRKSHDWTNSGYAKRFAQDSGQMSCHALQDYPFKPHHEPVSLFIRRQKGICSRREYSLTSSDSDMD